MKKEHYILLGIAAVVTLALVAVYKLFFRTKAWERLQGKIRTPSRSSNSQSPRPDTLYVPESFPLQQGMKGERIVQLQHYLKIEADGIWGPQTTAAYQKSNLYAASGKKAQLTQENYYAFQINMQ